MRSPRSWCRVLGVAGTLVVLLACVRQTMTGWTLWQVAAVDPYWDRALMTVAGLWALAGLVVLMVHGLPGVGRLRLVDVALVLAAGGHERLNGLEELLDVLGLDGQSCVDTNHGFSFGWGGWCRIVDDSLTVHLLSLIHI